MGWLGIHAPWIALIRPEVWCTAFGLVFAYHAAVHAAPRGGDAQPGKDAATQGAEARFVLGVASWAIALGSPLAYLAGGYLLTAHMVQFVLLGMVGAPLVVSGFTDAPWRALLPSRAVRSIGRFARPLPALAVFTLSFLFFQAPPLVDAGLRAALLYTVESVTLMLASVLLWWPVYGPGQREGAEPAGSDRSVGRLLYVFLTGFPGLILAAALVLFATGPVYTAYEPGEHVLHVPPFLDQQVAGILMQVGMTLARSFIFAQIALSWGLRADRAEREVRRTLAGGEAEAARYAAAKPGSASPSARPLLRPT